MFDQNNYTTSYKKILVGAADNFLYVFEVSKPDRAEGIQILQSIQLQSPTVKLSVMDLRFANERVVLATNNGIYECSLKGLEACVNKTQNSFERSSEQLTYAERQQRLQNEIGKEVEKIMSDFRLKRF